MHKLCTHCVSCASMGCSTTHCMISSAQSPSQNSYFIRRCIRTGFCSPDLADFHDLYISSDEKLFNRILTRPNHILLTLLPSPTAQNYSLRNRPHNRQLPDRISRITDFTVRMLYRNMYWLLYILDMRFVLFLHKASGLTVRNKRICYVIIPAKARDYVFTGVGLSVCLSVCYYDN